MTRESELMLYVLFGIPAVALVFFFLLVGPLGWFLIAFLGITVLGVRSVLGDDGDVDDASDRVNCPHCGARTDPTGSCDYCGEAF